jgi:hypothetical protein
MSSLLKASTSIDTLPGLATFVEGRAEASFSVRSIVANVFEKGLWGACDGLIPSSSSELVELVLSNGSSSRGTGIVGFVYVSSPIVEEESGMDGVEGEGGGGDCTRTFLGAFFGGSIFWSFLESARGCDCGYAM